MHHQIKKLIKKLLQMEQWLSSKNSIDTIDDAKSIANLMANLISLYEESASLIGKKSYFNDNNFIYEIELFTEYSKNRTHSLTLKEIYAIEGLMNALHGMVVDNSDYKITKDFDYSESSPYVVDYRPGGM